MTRILSTLIVLISTSPVLADYSIDWSRQHSDSVFWKTKGGVSTHGGSCQSFYDGGVVRSWYLKERNFRDYRKSYSFCRDMSSNGTLVRGSSEHSHFSYSGNGSTGNSSIPTDKVPVGVRTHWDFPLGGDWKLVDVEMLYDNAGHVAGARTNFDRAGDALNNDGALVDLQCNSGYLLTGLWVQAKHRKGGGNQAEIRGVKIECSMLRG